MKIEITQAPNLLTNGYLKTSGSDGSLYVETGSFYPLSSNPSGYVTGSVVRPTETGSFITTGQTGAFSSVSHAHGNITNIGAIGSTANLPIITTTSGALTVGAFGTGSTNFCVGNDSRLSDTRTPTNGSVTPSKLSTNSLSWDANSFDFITTDDSPYLQIGTNSSSAFRSSAAYIYTFKGGFNSYPLLWFTVGNGTSSVPAAIAANEILGEIRWYAYNSAATAVTATNITAYAAENYTTGAAGSIMTFASIATGTTALTERMRIASDGSILIGSAISTPNSHLTLGNTKGLKLPVMTTATRTGMATVNGLEVYDSDTNSLWVGTDTTWVAQIDTLSAQSMSNKTLTNPTINAATISGSIVGSPIFSNQPRFGGGLYVGGDEDIYLYESSANTLSIRTGPSGAYTFFTIDPTGRANIGGINILTANSTDTVTNKTLTNPTINSYVEGVVAIGTVTTTHTLSLTSGTVQTATLTASTACTFTMPTATAGKSFTLYLKQAAATGNGTATFTSVKWPAGTAPTITATAGKMDIISFVADGANWYGSFIQNYTP